MFGGIKGRGVTGTANAYMLMYRLYSKNPVEQTNDDEIPYEVK